MKKYWMTASLFLANIEIVSWIAALILLVMAIYDFSTAAMKEAEKR